MAHQTSCQQCTIDHRLSFTERRLVALEGAVLSLDKDFLDRASIAPTEQVIETVVEEIKACADEPTWLRNLPGCILNTSAPTDDEREAAARGVRLAMVAG